MVYENLNKTQKQIWIVCLWGRVAVSLQSVPWEDIDGSILITQLPLSEQKSNGNLNISDGHSNLRETCELYTRAQ